jgi:endoglucanase
MTMVPKLQLLSITCGALLLCTACIPKDAPGGGTADGATDPAAATPCPADGVIDDAEDNNHQSAVHKGRGGYWFTFVDKGGSTITPTAGAQGGTFAMSPGGANGSSFSAKINGQLATGGLIFAGMGVNFIDPKSPYDLSAYKGIAFMAKKGGTGTAAVRLKVPDANTDPDGKVCTECFNDFGTDIELTTEWTKYTVPFASMAQMTGWGSPRPAALELTKVYGLQWQVSTPGESYEIWVDDVTFTGCQ